MKIEPADILPLAKQLFVTYRQGNSDESDESGELALQAAQEAICDAYIFFEEWLKNLDKRAEDD